MPVRRQPLLELRPDPLGRPRIAEVRGADRDRRGPSARNSRASAPLSMPPIPITGTPTSAATRRTWSSAIGRTAGPESPPLPAPSHGFRGRRIEARRPQRVDQRDSVRPALLGGQRDRGRIARVRRQLHDQRLVGQGTQRLAERERLGRLLAHDQPRAHVRAGHVELDCRDLVACGDLARRAGRTRRGRSPSPRRSAAPAARASCGRSSARNPSRPLLGRPIELIIPLGVSNRRGGGLPARGSGVIVFETNAENGNRSSSASPNARCAAIASNVPRAVQHRVLELEAADP